MHDLPALASVQVDDVVDRPLQMARPVSRRPLVLHAISHAPWMIDSRCTKASCAVRSAAPSKHASNVTFHKFLLIVCPGERELNGWEPDSALRQRMPLPSRRPRS